MKNIKDHFSIFKNSDLVYLDSAATSQKPQMVIDAMTKFYSKNYANVGRGVYDLAEQATIKFESAREKVANFIGASASELIFTKGATDGINLVAQSWAAKNISPGDEIIVTELEHHSNFIPWQILAKEKGAVFKVVPVEADGSIKFESFEKAITPKTKLVSVAHISNVLGIELPIKKIADLAKKVGAKILVDAAQSVGHQKVDVKDLGCDFLAFSAHKMFGPTGIGALFVKKKLLDEMEPAQFGGGMVFEASKEKTTFLTGPKKFEAGTPPIAQAIGFAAAVDFINENIDFDYLKIHVAKLSKTLKEGLKKAGFKLLGPKDHFGSIVSFTHDKIHPHDIAAFLNKHKICVRAGDHCAQPLHKALSLNSSARISFQVYNDSKDIDKVLASLLIN